MFKFFIVYSKKKDRYFLGVTSEKLEEKVKYLNTSKLGYTSSTDDWALVHFELFETRQAAEDRKARVKSWKSRTQIEKLIFDRMN